MIFFYWVLAELSGKVKKIGKFMLGNKNVPGVLDMGRMGDRLWFY